MFCFLPALLFTFPLLTSFSLLGLHQLALLFGSPIAVFFFYTVCDGYKCNVTDAAADMWSGRGVAATLDATFGAKWRSGELLDPTGFAVYFGFVAVQVVLQLVLPGKWAVGETTPGGNQWRYHINGLAATVVSFVLFYFGAIHYDLFEPSVFYDHWLGCLVASQVFGYVLVFGLYVKASVAPSRGPNGETDVNFSGNLLADLYKGVELNARVGQDFDIKLFCVSRIGMMSWAFVNLSALFAQYKLHGFVSNSMILINAMQYFYIHDLLVREEWYTRTLDIMLDRCGFYMIWGVCCWVQVVYCLQSLWLIHHPEQLSTPWLLAALSLHVAGYVMFLDSNTQRTNFRADMAAAGNDASKVTVGLFGNRLCRRRPTYVTARWLASDGKPRTSLLLTSGYWGIARHFNYITDLCMCFAWGMSSNNICGAFLPWFYFFYMIALLVHRSARDERRLATKYGKDYLRYQQEVPYSFIPGVI